MKRPVYLDNHATTPVDPQVLEAMLPYYRERFGNAASRQHALGWMAEEAVDQARQQIATLLGAKPRELIFTSGATESNNLALFGVARRYRPKGNHLISVVTEHKALLDPLAALEKEGFQVTLLPVDRHGGLDLGRLAKAMTKETILISVMAANNEIGTIHPIQEIGTLAKEKGVLFHTDAAQAVGKIQLDVEEMGIDLLSGSAHKLYGPKGVGVLFIRGRDPHVQMAPLFYGGGHERGLRSGTLAVPLIVGLGKACQIAQEKMASEESHLQKLRDKLQAGIVSQLDGVVINGASKQRLPHNLSASFAGLEAQAIMMEMREGAVSSGSACTTASPQPSHVLRALGIGEELAHATLRFGLGRFTTEAEIYFAIEQVVHAVKTLRARSVPLRRSTPPAE